MSSVAVSSLRAEIFSPLRSKRAITSPVRFRSKASGLTRIRVRLTAGAPLFLFGGRRVPRRGGAAGGLFASTRRFRSGGACALFVPGFRRLFARAAFRFGAGFFQLAIPFAFALPLGAASPAAWLWRAFAGE